MTLPVEKITSFWRTVRLPSKVPRTSAMSISAEPLKAPCSAIWITREFMMASTVPSTTSVSQSVISTPLSLMLGPTVSVAPLSGAAGVAGAGVAAGAEKGWALLLAEPSELVPPSVELPGVRGAVGSSRLPKKGP